MRCWIAILCTLVSFAALAQYWTALGPWSTAVSPTEVVISWKSSNACTGWVGFWTRDELAKVVKTQENAIIQHVHLQSLLPGTRYYYRIILDTGEESPICSFTTPPNTFEPFRFLVYSDTQENHDRHKLVADRMASEKDVAFAIHLGDLVQDPSPLQWKYFFTSSAAVLCNMCFYPVIGNHERDSQSYYDLFELPKGGGRDGDQWWSFWWGDVLLVGLDSDLSTLSYRNFSVFDEETAWLKTVLAQDARFKFIFFHHPIYSSNIDEKQNLLAILWEPIFLDHHVTAVFSGHIHLYEHIWRNGIHYFVAGGGGGTFSRLREPRVEGSIFAATHILHYLRVDVEHDRVRVFAIPVGRLQGGHIVEIYAEPLEIVEIR